MQQEWKGIPLSQIALLSYLALVLFNVLGMLYTFTILIVGFIIPWLCILQNV